MVEIKIVVGDIISHPCDLLILKHADQFLGVDGLVADRIDFQGSVDEGDVAFVRGFNIEARKVLFLGVGPLRDFRYEKIRAFGEKALQAAGRGNGKAEVVASPIHGPGYGLDEKEAFLSLVAGFFDALDAGEAPQDLRRIDIVELSAKRAARLEVMLDEWRELSADSSARTPQASFGAESERKAKLFVAMPFADDYSDIWDVAIQDAAIRADVPCERIAEQSYVGDILSEIKKRVHASSGLLAVLDGDNPNVFLELGYAWALDKPTVLVVQQSATLPFDVRGQKCIMYKKMADLRTSLIVELTALKDAGVFG